MLIRVPSFTATIIPMLAGGAIALRTGRFTTPLWVDLFVVALFMQIATNVFNEHGDYVHGIDRFASHGFAGVIVKGEASAAEVLNIALAFYAVAALLAIPLVIERGIIVLAFGLFSAAIGVLYSEGPLPLSNTPLGEMIVGFTMGFVEVIATEFVSCGKITLTGYLVSVPVSLLVSAMLIANNIRDIEKDRMSNRKTLVVLLGKKYSQVLFYSVFALSYLWLLVMQLLTGDSMAYFPIITLPAAILGMRYLHRNGWKYGVEISSLLYLLYGIILSLVLTI